MRCCNCGRLLPDDEVVYVRGAAGCYPCYQRGVAAGRRLAVLVPLAFLAVVAAFFGAMVWFFPEITRR